MMSVGRIDTENIHLNGEEMMKKILMVALSVLICSGAMSFGGESDSGNYCWDTTNHPYYPATSNPWFNHSD